LQSIVESAPVKRRGNPYRDAEGKFCSESGAVYKVDSEGRLKKYTKKTGPPKLRPKNGGGNPNHDKSGKFASKSSSKAVSSTSTKTVKSAVKAKPVTKTVTVKAGIPLSSHVAKDRAVISANKRKGVSTQLKDAPETTKAVQSAYQFTSSNGMYSKVNLSSSRIDGDEIIVKGTIHNKDGLKVGDFQRTLYPKTNKVYNDNIKINPKYTGQRFGDEFIGHSKKQLASMGIKKVEYEANYDVGGYAHARRGATWGALGRKQGETNVAKRIDDYLKADSKKPVDMQLSQADRAQLEKWSERMRKPLTSTAPTPNDLASFGEGNYKIPRKTRAGREFISWPGKEIMLGATWGAEESTTSVATRSMDTGFEYRGYMDDIEKLYTVEEQLFIPDDELDPHGNESDFNMFHVDLILDSEPESRANPYHDKAGKFAKHSSSSSPTEKVGKDPSKIAAAKNDSESRASRTSKVERRIIKKPNICERCRLNNDPNKVPVHPHCDCDVISDSVEAGVADPESRFLKQLNLGDIAMEIVGDAEGVQLNAVQLNPDTTAILEGENARFADLARWLEQMQPYLDQGAQFVSIVVDDDTDEAVQQSAETLQSIAEGSTEISEAIRSRKLWFALAKAVVF